MISSFKDWLKQYGFSFVAGSLGVFAAFRFLLNRGSLWEDEIIAVTHGLQSMPLFFIEVLRNDIHPFFYFLLIKAWDLVFPGSDAWILSSSLVFGLVSLAIIFFCVRSLYGIDAAVISVSMLAVLPYFSWASGNLRMYSLLLGLAVLVWYGNRKFFEDGGWGWLLFALLAQLIHAYSHAINFYFAFFIALAVLIPRVRSKNFSGLKPWLAMQVIYVLMILPLVVSALVRGTEELGSPSLSSLIDYPLDIFSLWQPPSYPLPVPGALVLAPILIGLALSCRSLRPEVLIIFFGAICFAVIVALGLSKTMFKQPVFAANLLPFVVIPSALAVANWSRLWARQIFRIAIIFVGFGTFHWVEELPSSSTFKPQAEFLQGKTKLGDVVIVPNVSIYWGLMRYAVAPDWGYPLEVMPRVANPQWEGLRGKLGPNLSSRLGLIPKTDYVDHLGIKYVLGDDVKHISIDGVSRVWIFHKPSYKKTVRVESPVQVLNVWNWGDLQLIEAQPTAIGVREIHDQIGFR
ncbi:glycosyltransferase family 39 protein [Hydrogenophaga sp.]|uniref:glycosyltransferase family 39 protein n=1 Tax=Hydrogenophaga sp. TaxID=1904254 RepID=UPI0027193465|nr:glycosyltransferase family 39 protein [Hydrogenophaga sp.]MDO9132346.1 glycosyltransferase family 39 protein [Hydrogenophaga sp.]